MARREAGCQLPWKEVALLLLLLLLFRVVTFCRSPCSPSWVPQRDSVAAARATKVQWGRAVTVHAQFKYSCVAVESSSRTVQRE